MFVIEPSYAVNAGMSKKTEGCQMPLVSPFFCLVGCGSSVGWSVFRSVDRVFGCLVGCSVVNSVGRSVGLSVGQSVGWSDRPLVVRSVN